MCTEKSGLSIYKQKFGTNCFIKNSFSVEPYKRQTSLCAQLGSGTLPSALKTNHSRGGYTLLSELGEIENKVNFFCVVLHLWLHKGSTLSKNALHLWWFILAGWLWETVPQEVSFFCSWFYLPSFGEKTIFCPRQSYKIKVILWWITWYYNCSFGVL